jgi:predicted transcriptional regulator
MSDTRELIANHIRAYPGVHFNQMVRALDLAPGQIQHHLKTLLSQPSFVEEPLYGRTHYFPSDYDPWQRRTLALLRRETTRDIVGVLLTDGPASPGTVAEELDIARSTLEWHLDRLVEQQVVVKQRDQHNRVTLTLERPEALASLLRDADPTLLARMTDRFTRLVDRLLTE